MKNNYHLDELESFLSESADQHRMYPSDKVWRNIDKELHGQKKWPALTFGALLTGAIITAGLILIHPDKNLFNVDQHSTAIATQQAKVISDETKPSEKFLNQKALAPAFSAIKAPASNSHSKSVYRYNEVYVGASVDVSKNQIIGKISASPVENSIENVDEEMLLKDNLTISPSTDVVNSGLMPFVPSQLFGEKIQLVPGLNNEVISNQVIPEIPVVGLVSAEVDNSMETITTNKVADLKKPKTMRWGIEYYATPSYSYRYLTESKIVDLHLAQNGPIAPNLLKPVNNFVNHTPILGLEAGAGIVFQATPTLQIKAGMQANMRGYTIEAYAASWEPSTLVLNRGFYTDSIFGVSSYSNQGGYKTVELTNRYWQIALPIGMNLKMIDGKKLQLHVSASIQPTYQFNNSMYILSNDYKNYQKEPSLVRQWNVNTAIGAFVSYQAAGLNWQIGPQIRYQVFSGTISDYPINEHLLDYGLKIGVVKTLK